MKRVGLGCHRVRSHHIAGIFDLGVIYVTLALALLKRAEVRGRKRRRIQEEEELFTSSIVQVRSSFKHVT